MDLEQEALVNFMAKHDEAMADYVKHLILNGETCTIAGVVNHVEQMSKMLLAFEAGYNAA